jgi:hypothetical protein
MIEFFTIVDVTGGDLTTRAAAGYGYSGGKVHCFDNEGAAKRRRTLLANKHPKRKFAIFVTIIRNHGSIASEWITTVSFPIPAAGQG